MGTYTNIGNQIQSIIQAGISGVDPGNVYNFVKRNPAGYPSISIEAFDGAGQFLDTGRNRRTFIFRIICSQERTNVGEDEAERILRQLVDQLLTLFDSRTNLNLNNSCNFAHPIPSKWGYIQAPDIDVRSAEILLEAVDVQ